MRALLTNLGSTGDVQPLINLAVELQHHGHRAELALPPYFGELAAARGCGFIPLGPHLDFRAIQRRTLESLARGEDPLELRRESADLLRSMLPRMFDELSAACRTADVLISGPLQPAAPMIHELTRIPFVAVLYNHFGGAEPEGERRALTAVINPFRASLGLPPVAFPSTRDAASPQLTLYAISRHVLPPAASWPPHFHMIGFFFAEDERGGDSALQDFLEDGDPPVFVTFGSMVHADPRRVSRVVLEAIERSGRRAVVQGGWSGLFDGPLPPQVRATEYVSYRWLLPRVAAVVHHGGIGTTAETLRAGVPSVFVPHAWEQPLWAQLVGDLGCTAPPIPVQELSSKVLGDRITELATEPRYHLAAGRIAAEIRREQGLAGARRLIEHMLQGMGLEDSTPHDICAEASRAGRIRQRRSYQQQRRRSRARAH